MGSKAALIHIGYHKTASTWLQKHLFGNPETGFKRYLQKEIRKWIVTPNALTFDAAATKKYYDSLIAQDSSSIPVISSERLSGNPHYGGYDIKEIADKLSQVFPGAKILMIIREQGSAIGSSYLQYVKSGGTCSAEDYFEPRDYDPPIAPWFSFEHFNYWDLAAYYAKLFGKENLLILPYELFRKNPQEFCKRILEFSGAKEPKELPFKQVVNSRLSALGAIPTHIANQLLVRSRFNPGAINLGGLQHYITRFFVRLDSFLPKALRNTFDRKLDQLVKDRVQDRYRAGNKALAEFSGLKLEEYGYLL